jgi:hypothetical protein
MTLPSHDAFVQSSATSRNAHFLVGAFAVSTIGDCIYQLALPLLVLKITGSAFSAAVTYALEYAPYIVFSLFGGVVADRVDRKWLLIMSDACSAGIVGILAALVISDVQQVALIYLGAFALSSVRPFYHPAFQSIVPSLVPDEQLPKTNARIRAVESILSLAGPVIGVGIVAAMGLTTALLLNTISFVLSALSISLIRIAFVTGSNIRSLNIRTDLEEGVRYILRDRITMWASILMAGTNISLCLIEANLIYYIVWLRDLPVEAVGIVFGAQGAGCLLGAMFAPWLSKKVKPGHLIVSSMVGMGAMTSSLILPLGLAGIAFSWGAVGIFTMLITVTWITLRQRLVPQVLLGRVVSLSRMMSFIPIPLASVGGGVLLSVSDSAVPLVAVAVLVQIAVGTAAWLTPLRSADVPVRSKLIAHAAYSGVHNC